LDKDLEERLHEDISELRKRMDCMEIHVENIETNIEVLTGMTSSHLTIIVLAWIIVALLLVSINVLMFYESTLLLWSLI